MMSGIRTGLGIAAVAAAVFTAAKAQRLALTSGDQADRAGNNQRDGLEKAKRYSRERVKLWLLNTGWQLGFGSASIAAGVPNALFDRISERISPKYQTPAFILGWSLYEWAASLPLAYYSGYIVERRYGLTGQTSGGWAADAGKALVVGTVLNVPMLTGFYYVVRRWPDRWWLIASGAGLPATVLMVGLYPVLIAPIFNRYEPLEDRELEARIRGIAENEGVHVSQVMCMDMSRQTNKANAFFAGMGRTRRIVLADTMLGSFTPEEIEVVVAHELAHQVHKDNWKLVALAGTTTVAGSYALSKGFNKMANFTRSWTGAREIGDVRTLPLLGLVIGAMSLCGLPFINAFVRAIERSADRYAIRVTNDPRAFIGAMRKLQSTNLDDPDPPAIVKYTLHSHPTIGERIRWAERQIQ